MSSPPPTFVSRGGLKLHHALATFNLDVTGLTCADLGCSTGGFTDCLLHAGASRVYAVDTAYGQLAWKLRKDPRVVVMERHNALHASPPEGGVDLVVVDLGWTPQRLLVPAALKWLKGAASVTVSPSHPLTVSSAVPLPAILTLIKPHYELKAAGQPLPHGGILEDELAEQTKQSVVDSLPALGVRVLAVTPSPIRGSAATARSPKGTGNAEWLALLAPVGT